MYTTTTKKEVEWVVLSLEYTFTAKTRRKENLIFSFSFDEEGLCCDFNECVSG
jgi:hypothetical protein